MAKKLYDEAVESAYESGSVNTPESKIPAGTLVCLHSMGIMVRGNYQVFEKGQYIYPSDILYNLIKFIKTFEVVK